MRRLMSYCIRPNLLHNAEVFFVETAQCNITFPSYRMVMDMNEMTVHLWTRLNLKHQTRSAGHETRGLSNGNRVPGAPERVNRRFSFPTEMSP
jgi:hypothetical protein